MHQVNEALHDIIQDINMPIALCISSGIDSKSLLFECIKQNKKITGYTFAMKGIDSLDLIDAKRTCKYFNINHVTVRLPLDLETLVSDIKIIKKMGAVKKTDIECFWPFLYLYKEIPKDHTVLSGLGADGHFCISKKGMIHFRDNIEKFREGLFDNNPKYAQKYLHIQIGVPHVMPFLTPKVREVFKNKSWHDLNTPIQKAPIVRAYIEYFKKVKLYKHTNLQLGDSGIAVHFEKLLKSKYNIKNSKNVIGIYNSL